MKTMSLGATQYVLTYMIRATVVPQAPKEFLTPGYVPLRRLDRQCSQLTSVSLA